MPSATGGKDQVASPGGRLMLISISGAAAASKNELDSLINPPEGGKLEIGSQSAEGPAGLSVCQEVWQSRC